MFYRKYRDKVTQYEFYKYPITKCKCPTFKGRYSIYQKPLSVSLITVVSLTFQLNKDVLKGCQLLTAIVEGNQYDAGLYMRELCRLLVPLLQSPLAAAEACTVIVKLGASAFDDEKFGMYP